MRLYAAVQCGSKTRKAVYEAEHGELVRGEMGGWRMDKVMHGKLLCHEADRHLNGEKGCFKREPLIQFPPEISLHLHTVF